MATRRTLHTLLGVILALGLLLPAISTPTGVSAADVDEKKLSALTNRLGLLITRSGATGLQAAIWLSDVEDCTRNRVKADKTGEESLKSAMAICVEADRDIPSALVESLYYQLQVSASITPISGVWISNFGPATIDSQGHMVVTFVKGRGEGIADISLTYANEDYYSYTYKSYFNNDQGYGVLYLTSDGCALIGKFRSTKDRTNNGAFNLIRCSWNGQE